MKANELMIGDWVLHDGEPYQIRQLGIYGVDRDGEDYPAICVGKPKGVGLIVERNEIEPISLTPEILEKNGFFIDTYKDGYEKFWVRGDFVFGINGFTSVGRNNFKIEYVHQLQHALRLCGIEKEIVL